MNTAKFTESENTEIDYLYLLYILWKYRIAISISTFVFIVISVIYALTAQRVYISQVTMYPITKDQGGLLKELSSQLGIGSKPEGFYLPDVLESRRISKKVIFKKYWAEGFKDSINLMQFWEIDKKNMSENMKIDLAINKLASSIDIREDKETTLISLKVYSNDKIIAKQMASYYVTSITEFLQYELISSISSTIIFTEKRLKEAQEELLAAETALIEFQEKNTKLSSPSLSIENTRKYFRIQLAKDVVSLLQRQVDLLRIEQVRLKPVINLLDEPDIHDKHIKPARRRIVMTGTFIGFLTSFLFLTTYQRLKEKKLIQKISEYIRYKK